MLSWMNKSRFKILNHSIVLVLAKMIHYSVVSACADKCWTNFTVIDKLIVADELMDKACNHGQTCDRGLPHIRSSQLWMYSR